MRTPRRNSAISLHPTQTICIENYKLRCACPGVSPNQGIKASVQNNIILTLLIVIISLLSWFGFSLLFQAEIGQYAAVIFGVVLMVVPALSFSSCGGLACVQHLALRIVLWWSKLSPWNYAKFLAYATDRRFIQQVGGRYRFIHRLLRDHFAAME